jgi:hypothetical protein
MQASAKSELPMPWADAGHRRAKPAVWLPVQVRSALERGTRL